MAESHRTERKNKGNFYANTFSCLIREDDRDYDDTDDDHQKNKENILNNQFVSFNMLPEMLMRNSHLSVPAFLIQH